MIRRSLIVAAGILLLGGVIGTAILSSMANRLPDNAPTEAVMFEVERGEPFSRITQRLHAQRLIGHPYAVAVYAWLRKFDRRVRAGMYLIEPGESPKSILAKLVTGKIYEVSVTVPEGLMRTEVAGIFAAEMGVDSLQFMSVPAPAGFTAPETPGGTELEGYLFPDTYVLPWGMSADEIVAAMVARTEAVFDEALLARADSMGLTRHEVLTLASIIQAETGLPGEVRLVSAVYHNRLRRGMRLEADPTVAYAKGGYRGRLFYKDLEIDSPYNTYRRSGLPPGPICGPGEAAIYAALFPDRSCLAIYFVARGDGGHVFSRTLSEHEAAIREARRNRKR